MRILVSACLLGISCRHDGTAKRCEAVLALDGRHVLIPTCPEQLGGLPTPRLPVERCGARCVNSVGEDVTAMFARGADETLALARTLRCAVAVLKSRSPSCGKGVRYDGTFSGVLTSGHGVAAQALLDAGIPVYTEEEIAQNPQLIQESERDG